MSAFTYHTNSKMRKGNGKRDATEIVSLDREPGGIRPTRRYYNIKSSDIRKIRLKSN